MKCVLDSSGTKKWYLNGKFHRVDGPAIEYASGTKSWYLDGKLHRIDGPAIEWHDGEKHWYINNERHRLTGPAVECPGGTKMWYLNGQRHRIDGPALEWADGEKQWFLNGYLHRVDGPALEYLDGTKIWYLNGRQISQSEYYAFLRIRKFHSRKFRFNYALNFNISQILNLSRNKAVVEWYYSPDNGGGKLAKKRLGSAINHICSSVKPIIK